MTLRYDTVLVVMFFSILATALYYYLVTRIIKLKNRKITYITTGLFFVVYGIAESLTHLIPYRSSQTVFNILRYMFYLVPTISGIFFIYLGFKIGSKKIHELYKKYISQK